MPASTAASPSVKYLQGSSWARNPVMMSPSILLNGAEFGKVYQFPRIGNAASAPHEQAVVYSDTLLVTFATSLILLVLAAVSGIAGWAVENDGLTYVGLGSALLGGAFFVYSARAARRLLS